MTFFSFRSLHLSVGLGIGSLGLFSGVAHATPVPAQVYVADAPKKVATFPNFIRASALPVQNSYPSAGHAERDLKKAFETAGKTHQLVLVSFGSNWSADCNSFAGVLALQEMQEWVSQNFILVNINVSPKEGKFNKNMEIAKRYGVIVKSMPTVLAFTPRGTLLNVDSTGALGNAHELKPQEIADMLNLWLSRAPRARQIEMQNTENAVRAEAIAAKAKQMEELRKKQLKKGQSLGTNYYENGQIVHAVPVK